MKNKPLYKIIKKISNLFKKYKLFYGHSTYNEYSESIHLIYSILNLNINKKYKNIKINKKKIKKIIKLAKIRINTNKPIAYITKNVWYCNKKFYIDERSIIPRSPIGKIILNKFKNINKKKYYPKNILDLCTGSGCLAIICSYMFPKSKIDASDISKKTLEIAKKNIILHKINNINLIKSNLFKNIKKKYDLIITNPPYISYKEKKYLPKEYFFEPSISLFTYKNGLYIIEKIINKFRKYLNKKGILICEVGHKKKYIIKKKKNIKFKWIKTKNKNNNILYIKKY